MVLIRQYCPCHYSYKDIADDEPGTNLRLHRDNLSKAALDALAILNIAGNYASVEGLGTQFKEGLWVLTALKSEDIQCR